ncbi:reverse transcriptase domain-containing protein [Tanacetum coccineum]
MKNDDGIFLFKFANSRGMKQVLDRVPIWVKLHKVPLVVYSEDDLSLIATQIGKPLMLDAYTSFMCGEAWGRINFTRALIEVSSDSDLKKEVTMVIPNEDEMDYTREVISVEYEWQPPRCVDCKKFCHSSDRCPKIIREPITPVYIDTNSDGFKEVQRKKINDKKVDLQPRLRQKDGKGPSTSNSFNVLNTMDVEDKSGTPSSRCNQEEEHEERIKELDEFDEDVDEFIFPEEAEYIAASEAAMEDIWIRKFILGLDTAIEDTTTFANCIELGKINLLKVHTDDNLADPFTKALPKGKLTQHARSIGLRLASSFC